MGKAKYYHYDKIWKRYRVMRRINGKRVSYGTYATEKEAEKVVQKLTEANWDRTKLPYILEDLGIKSKIKRKE